MIIKTTMEPNKIAASFKKRPALISGSLVALEVTAIDATNGSSQSMDWWFVRICSGAVKVAITRQVIIDILFSVGFFSAKMG